MKLIRVKKAFTLIELIIVILIITVSYALIFSNNSFSLKVDEKKLNLFNLKDYLIENFSFEKEISFLCIEEDFRCFIKIDGKLHKDFEVKNFFKEKPEVYTYTKYETRVDFKELRVDNFNYDVIFELKIDSDFKINEFILDTKEEVYVFNSIFTKPKVFNSLNESLETFNIGQIEVRDAF